jgi:hypothetical protein
LVLFSREPRSEDILFNSETISNATFAGVPSPLLASTTLLLYVTQQIQQRLPEIRKVDSALSMTLEKFAYRIHPMNGDIASLQTVTFVQSLQDNGIGLVSTEWSALQSELEKAGGSLVDVLPMTHLFFVSHRNNGRHHQEEELSTGA